MLKKYAAPVSNMLRSEEVPVERSCIIYLHLSRGKRDQQSTNLATIIYLHLHASDLSARRVH